MERKERIYKYISSDGYVPLKFDELMIVLDVPEGDRDELSKILDTLVREGKIFKAKKGRYCPVAQSAGMAAGVLMCSMSGFGFVRCDGDTDNDIFIPHKGLGIAYDGDTVLVHIDKKNNEHGHREGHIEKILERGNARLVGVVSGKKQDMTLISPDRRSFWAHVRVADEDLNGAQHGDRVLVAIKDYDKSGKPVGVVEVVLGRADSVLTYLDGLLLNYAISECFPDEVMRAADRLPGEVTDGDIKNREDYRDKIIFTIDGDDSRDFDDAVSLEPLGNGKAMLGVHIADVTHYVRDGSAIDKEALSRGTSVYFPHRVIPMLPERLSNGICSLNPDTDRLTLSVMMEVDGDGNIINHRLVESVIHSCARMTYNNVNKILAGDTKLREQYDFIVPTLEAMAELSEKMAKKRSARGAIDFDFPEAKIACGSDGVPTSVEIDERGKSHRLIESFMLAANETIAEAAYWAELPFVYRVHESPGNEKITAFNEFIKNFGYSLRGKADSESIHPKDIQKILEAARGTPEEMMISQMALRSLMKACYRETNDGHFGLAARYYCHFTSPIRRYPDLMIHRVLKELINGRLSESKQAYFEPRVKEAAAQASEREMAAEKAERDADDILKAAYMQQFLGESFDAVISSVMSFGMFATLENTCEGLIRCENIQGDYYEFNESSRMLIGKHSGKTYKIGDYVRVTVAACDILTRRIDFVLEGEESRAAMERIERRNRGIVQDKSERKRRPVKRKFKAAKRKRKR